jgi:hypothetical protein
VNTTGVDIPGPELLPSEKQEDRIRCGGWCLLFLLTFVFWAGFTYWFVLVRSH